MVSQRPFPKHWLQKGEKPILSVFQTELLIVMDLQNKIYLQTYVLGWWILIKYFGNSLLFNKSVKIQDGFFQRYIINYFERRVSIP